MQVDMLIKDAWVYQTVRRVFEKKQVYLLNDSIYYVATELDDTLSAKITIEAEGQYLIPGLIDIHMHIESSMTTPEIFSQTVLPYGVTTVVYGEIANRAKPVDFTLINQQMTSWVDQWNNLMNN